jgi:methionyl-tRNA formyltransferase
MRVAFLGTPEPAVPALQALLGAADVEVAAVITNPDRPRDRGHRLAPPPVKQAATEAGVEVWQPAKPAEIAGDLAALGCDTAAVVAYGAILGADVLSATRCGVVNLHFSLLPAWRGAAPVCHAILAGETTTGVTCFVLDEGMDTGPILLRATEAIHADDTAATLTARLAQRGAPLLVDALRGLVHGSLTPTPQPAEAAATAPKLGDDDARLDWTRPADQLERAVRAFDPVPGAHTTLGDRRIKIIRAAVVDGIDAAGAEPGTVLDAGAAVPSGGSQGPSGPGSGDNGWRPGRGQPVVVCGDGRGLAMLEVQPSGKTRMDGHAFVNGYQPVGARLGS